MATYAPITGAPSRAPSFPAHLTHRFLELDPAQSHLAPILGEIERYLIAHQMAAYRFGMVAMGDPRFVYDLRKGRDPSSRVCERARYFMRGEATHARK